ncbi:hypothetical protein [Acinetobacter pullicarnis]|uniref:hypothetical protein n=1 Tax=Acinetobacter pullicarnis TaxID=2576829 RepID=UPI00148EC62A|nr:hypothetical protein [Acinetobacter pullicarnis]
MIAQIMGVMIEITIMIVMTETITMNIATETTRMIDMSGIRIINVMIVTSVESLPQMITDMDSSTVIGMAHRVLNEDKKGRIALF